MSKLRFGHAPGHVRDTFCAAVEAFMAWKAGQPEPTVEYEVQYRPTQIPISGACRMLWNCTDVIPGSEYRILTEGAGLAIGRQTYAACAQAMLPAIQAQA